mmetsp:Transcript_6204/g.12362  ORF Transcript_6204/g.12362 Transcript_6204/m.12362 type:complete len:337 (-) Transcript_6204:251-1261(-)
MMTTFMVQLTCVSSVVRAEGPSDGSPVTAMIKAMMAKQEEQITTLVAKVTKQEEQIREQAVQMTALKVEMEKKGEAIAALTDALTAIKTGREQAKASPDEVDTAQTAAQDARIGMAVSEMGEERGAPPAISPLPSVETPGRRMASDDSYVNEISVTGPTAVVSWNGYTPGLTPFNCTGVGDGILTCSGPLYAEDLVTLSGVSILELQEQVNAIRHTIRYSLAVTTCSSNVDSNSVTSGTITATSSSSAGSTSVTFKPAGAGQIKSVLLDLPAAGNEYTLSLKSNTDDGWCVSHVALTGATFLTVSPIVPFWLDQPCEGDGYVFPCYTTTQAWSVTV